MREWSFTDEPDQPADQEPVADVASEYVFEGFTVEFSDRVMLIPVGPNKLAAVSEPAA
jgi:hypothetical protein